jgi:hypothetical protein
MANVAEMRSGALELLIARIRRQPCAVPFLED